MEDESALYAMLSSNAYDVVDIYSATVFTDMTPLINIIMHKVRVEEATQGRAANE